MKELINQVTVKEKMTTVLEKNEHGWWQKNFGQKTRRGAGFFRPNLPRCERLSCWKKRSLIINRGKSIKYDNIFVSILPQANWELSVVVKKGSGKAFQRNEL
jgi:hypothetical protein